jgi:hypothetical protein
MIFHVDPLGSPRRSKLAREKLITRLSHGNKPRFQPGQKQGRGKKDLYCVNGPVTQNRFRERGESGNRLLSALISNLGGQFKITARFTGPITFSAIAISARIAPG